MKIMVGQLQEIDEETAAFARQLGVTAVQLNTPRLDDVDGYWTYEALTAVKQRCANFGLELVALENVPQPFMQSIKLGAPTKRGSSSSIAKLSSTSARRVCRSSGSTSRRRGCAD